MGFERNFETSYFPRFMTMIGYTGSASVFVLDRGGNIATMNCFDFDVRSRCVGQR